MEKIEKEKISLQADQKRLCAELEVAEGQQARLKQALLVQQRESDRAVLQFQQELALQLQQKEQRREQLMASQKAEVAHAERPDLFFMGVKGGNDAAAATTSQDMQAGLRNR